MYDNRKSTDMPIFQINYRKKEVFSMICGFILCGVRSHAHVFISSRRTRIVESQTGNTYPMNYMF